MIQKMLKYIQRKRDENMKELIVATTNQGKVKEIQAMLKDLNIEVKSLKDVYDENKKLKTKELAGQIGSSHLSFASEKAMENLLCTFPGAVSILGLIYDKENKVQLLIDKEILESTYIGCHPCVNTCSLKIRLEDILKILLPKISHQNFNIVEL